MKIDQASTKKQVPRYANVNPDKIKILKQYLREKDYAVKLRQVKINNWIKNEELYNGVVKKSLLTRANLHVPIVFEGVQNMSSKIGAAPEPEYDTIPEGDENAHEIMKHVVKDDLHDCDFDTTFENSKVESGLYGRTIYKVIPGNDKQRVELVDTLAYLISPIAKNTKDALYQGQQFIYKTMAQLDEEKDKMEYDEEELAKLREGKMPAEIQSDSSAEASVRNLRTASMGLANVTQYGSKVMEITEWVTYLKKGKKAELTHLTVANDVYLLRAKPSKELGLKRPNFVSWGNYTRGITFWAPALADVYRDPNLAINVNINQIIDNNTYRNFGMMFVSSSSGFKQSSLIPRPLGVTPITCSPNEKVQDKIWQFTPPEITSAITTMQTVKNFADSASGMSPAMPMNQKGKLSVTQMAKLNAEVDAKIKVMKRNATLACQELYQLMADIIVEKMTKPRKVKIFGFKALTLEDVTKKNFQEVELVAHATASEENEQNKAIKQKAKIDLYTLFKDDPKIPGQLALRRSVAKTFDVEPEEIEAWFTEEEQNKLQPVVPTEEPPTPGQPAQPPAEATPLLSATAQGAAANVPKSF
jgi:hypothetical protein